MRSFISSIMLLFFLAGQFNLTLAAHYCGDELKSTEVTIVPEKQECCGDEGRTIEPDCCFDEYASSESDDYFGKADFQIEISPEFILAYVLTIPGHQLEDIQLIDSDCLFPQRPTPDLNILYQSLLI
ncbi:hypothetical protein LZF95_01920 [Algoriphagus sp. AGSA1]|uniref:HYC_CC_PP family protein n=1 Tax=Algoriphagus sp. AGSA1 TaxID=2907213 RepID=UPI001F1ECBE3|nr:hypothetical protein [Algoriphagus sp. AGSA1]MCE7053416.1 hypothetical protein [Algoriphagus sp. AGSA1]